ncbi:MAG TPA: hypothetical protein VKG80_13120 [Trebonia sp.]|nr:hypothetical protein [Trebonia sp.]
MRWASVITALLLAGAITRYGLTHPANRNPDLANAFTSGANRLIQAFLQPLWPGHEVPAPGPIGWGVLAFLLFMGYRGLEWWALRRQAPLLDTSAIGDGQPSILPDGAPDGWTDGQRHEQLAAELKFRLCAIEIRAPAILPAGSKTNGLASIAEATGLGGAGLAGAIIQFAGMLWPNPRRIVLHVWVEPPAGAAGGSPASAVKVTVDLDEPGTGATVSAKTVVGADINEAASMVAGFVAQEMFAMDRTTPRWCYGAADGRDLGALLLSRMEHVNVESSSEATGAWQARICRLWREGSASRAAGIVRYELAQLLELDSRDLAALRLHAMNREEHSRFYRARYRLAMSLEMISNPDHEPFGAEAENVLNEVFTILRRCRATEKPACLAGEIRDRGDRVHHTLSSDLRMELLNIAARELRDVRRQLTLPFVMWATFAHRDERAIWLPHWWPRHRQAFRDAVCVAELMVAARQALIARERRESGEKPDLAPDVRLRHLWLGNRIAAAIAGNCSLAWWICAESNRPLVRRACALLHKGQEPGPPTGEPAPVSARDRVRWLPWLRRTASWQAAYNTACLYAALASIRPAAGAPADKEPAAAHPRKDPRLKYENKVVVSLERAISNPLSEMERAHDWISVDPDFTVLRKEKAVFKKFDEFVTAQDLRDYPAAFGQDTAPVAGDGGEPVAGDPLGKYIVPLQG